MVDSLSNPEALEVYLKTYSLSARHCGEGLLTPFRPFTETRQRRYSRWKAPAFTLTELVVVLACLSVILLTILPAFAGGWEKSTRLQCADNLRQLHAASVQYANDNSGLFPLWTHPGTGQINVLLGAWYSRYVFQGGPPGSQVPMTSSPPAGMFENAGHLYGAGLIGDGRALYCPTLGGLNHVLGAQLYEPLLTTDTSGTVRSSYNYNPRVINPNSGDLREFQKASDLVPQKLFMVDYVGEIVRGINHDSERGFNVLFTDGSVRFSQHEDAYRYVSEGLIPRYNNTSLMRVLDWLEAER